MKINMYFNKRHKQPIYRLAISALVFLFVLTSPGLGLAAEDVATGNNQAASTDTTTTDVSVDASQIDSNTDQTTTDEIQVESTKSTDQEAIDKLDKKAEEEISPESTQSLASIGEQESNDQNASLSKLRLTVDEATGALVYNFPLSIPPGRNKLQPDLTLTYHSHHGDHTSPFGFGWSINIPYIERIPKKGVDKLYSGEDEYFYSSLSGELATTTTASEFQSRVNNGDFLKYEFIDDEKWQVTDKSGTLYKFGYSTSTQLYNSTSTYRWMLEEVRDMNDNYISYEYYHDSNQVYPSKIKYTGYDTTDGIFEIEFLRESRIDDATVYNTGFAATTNYRISEIQIKISNSWVKKYELDYSAGDNGYSSLLTTITETGRDESASTITLPVNDFSYNTKDTSWEQQQGYTIPEIFTDGAGNQYGVRLTDVNGDGLIDMIRSHYDGQTTYKKVYINNGDETGWAEDTNYSIPEVFIENSGADVGTRLADVNGDGFMDIIRSDDRVSVNKVYINKKDGTGWAEDTNYSVPVNLIEQGIILADVNGDGLVDVMKSHYSNDPVKVVYINKGDGTGWAEDSDYTIPLYINEWNDDVGVRFADVNGDGLIDILKSYYNGVSQKYVYINKGDGTGWAQDTNYVIPQYFINWTDDFGVRLYDINGDGLVDVIRSHYDGQSTLKYVYINKGDGTGWAQDTNYSVPEIISENTIDAGTRVVDVNGDGLVDFIRSVQYGQDTIKNVYHGEPDPADLLNDVEESNNLEFKVKYKSVPTYRDGSGDVLNTNMPQMFFTVYTNTVGDGLGNYSTSTYTYSDGHYYYESPYEKQFGGFGIIEKEDPEGNIIKTYYHQGNESATSTGEFSDDRSKIGKVYRIEKYDDDDNLYQKIINKWENVDQGSDADFVKNTQTIDFIYDGDVDHKDKASTYTYSNTNGNLTQKVEWGQVTGSDNGSFTDTGTDKFTTDIDYAASTTLHILGLPKIETLSDQSSNKVSEVKHYYDNLSYGNVSKGNETKTEMWKSSTTYIDIEKTYNSYGLVTQEKDPRDKATNYTYDQYNLYVATSTNPLSQATDLYYDYSNGKVKKTVDPNDREFEIVYDALDRIKQEKQPDQDSPASLVTKTNYTYTDGINPRKIQVTNYLNSATSTEIYTYINGFDKPIQERTEAEDYYSVKDYAYDKNNNLASESLPYFSSGTNRTTATSTQSLFTNYTYDALNRVTDIVNVVGTTTKSYDDWKVTITDPESNYKDLYYDAYGNLIQVDEHNDASTYTTEYEYNGLKNLTKITDAEDNVRNFTYDGLGRRLTAQDLHDTSDSYYGTWTYTYDDSGNVSSVVDPNSQTIEFSYDDTNRVLTEDYTGDAGTEVQYGYDWCGEGVGRLCSATSTDAIIEYSYFATGNIENENKTINSTDYLTSYEYDRQGNITYIEYPDGQGVKYLFNDAGLLEKVLTRTDESSAYQYVIEDYNYSPLGQISYQKYANGTETTNTYDPDELYRLKHKVTEKTGGMEMAMAMTPDTGSPLRIALLDSSNTDIAVLSEFDYQDKTYDISAGSIKEKFQAAKEIKQEYKLEKASLVKEPKEKDDIKIAIGDKNSNEFEPELKITKWDEEVSFSIKPKVNKVAKKDRTVLLDDSTIKFRTPDEEYHFYSLPVSKDHPEGAYEFEVLLDKKPKSNVFEFDIDAKGLNFYYQGELTKDEENQGDFRPENVTGSYAAYHESKRDNQYKTGKAFHIYRPRIFDSNDNWIWGKLNIDEEKGLLSITVPQEFLNNAQYPVIVDPTFGYSSIGASQSYYINTWIAGGEYETGTDDGVMEDFNVALKSSSAVQCEGALYQGSSRVGVTSEEDVSGASYAWHTFSFSSPININGSTDYKMVNNCNGANGITYTAYDSVAGFDLVHINHDYGTWDSTITFGNVSNRKQSVYSTYSVVPIITTNKATNTNDSSATLNGYLDIGEYSEVETFFNYGTTPAYGATTTPVTKTTDTSFSGSVSDLNTLDLYYYRGGASSSTNYWYGNQELFYTGDVSTTTWETSQWLSGNNSTTTAQDGLLKLVAQLGSIATTTDDFESVADGSTNLSSSSWYQRTDDDGDWQGEDDNSTPSSGTGPQSGAYNGTHFIYTESSSGQQCQGTDVCGIQLDINGGNGGVLGAIDLNYHAYGSSLDYINFQTYNGTSWSTEWQQDGGSQNAWKNQYIEFGADTEKIRIDAKGTNWSADYAVDYLQVGTSTSSYTSGTWISQPSSLSGITNVGNSKIEWSSNLPANTTITVYTAINTSSTSTPSTWTEATSGNSIPNVSGDLSSKYLWVKIDLASSNGENTPSVDWLSYGINNSESTDYLQDLTYTYDSVGNIVQIDDSSNTNSAKTVNYLYDDLYRLTSASSTDAVASDFLRTYSYNSIGNISTKSDQGTYYYTGDEGTSYANPHAVTDIASSTLIYDNNGNLTNYGSWNYTWDYKNRLASAGDGQGTSTYAYDHEGQRVKLDDDSNVTYFPNKYYNIQNSTTTKHIFANDQLIATIEGSGVATSTYYVHTDHLTGSNVVTDSDGNLEQLVDYYPYGDIRIDEKESGFDEQRKFTGHEYDSETDLNYMGARYYPATYARFLSQDPVAMIVPEELLIDPQQLNTYSYTRNNPLIYLDPTGEFLFLAPIAAYIATNATAIAITATALTGATASTWHIGEAVGNLQEGNQQAFNQSMDNAMITQAASLAGITTELAAYESSYKIDKPSQKNQTLIANPPIDNSKGRFESHVYPKHINRSINTNSSKFNQDVDVWGLIQKNTQQPMIRQPRGNYERCFDAGKNIGFDRNINAQTSRMTIITDKNQSTLITSFPGEPTYKTKMQSIK